MQFLITNNITIVWFENEFVLINCYFGWADAKERQAVSTSFLLLLWNPRKKKQEDVCWCSEIRLARPRSLRLLFLT